MKKQHRTIGNLAVTETQSPAMRLLLAETALGWLAVLSDGKQIHKLKMGYAESADLLRDCQKWQAPVVQPNPAERRWVSVLKKYATGHTVDLQDLPLVMPHGTDFQDSVRRACRQIPAGKVLTYGQVAQKAGYPQAARAVGSVMSRNELPLLIPCHRVVGTQGLGGFSAPSGLTLKRQLLALEKSAIH